MFPNRQQPFPNYQIPFAPNFYPPYFFNPYFGQHPPENGQETVNQESSKCTHPNLMCQLCLNFVSSSPVPNGVPKTSKKVEQEKFTKNSNEKTRKRKPGPLCSKKPAKILNITRRTTTDEILKHHPNFEIPMPVKIKIEKDIEDIEEVRRKLKIVDNSRSRVVKNEQQTKKFIETEEVKKKTEKIKRKVRKYIVGWYSKKYGKEKFNKFQILIPKLTNIPKVTKTPKTNFPVVEDSDSDDMEMPETNKRNVFPIALWQAKDLIPFELVKTDPSSSPNMTSDIQINSESSPSLPILIDDSENVTFKPSDDNCILSDTEIITESVPEPLKTIESSPQQIVSDPEHEKCDEDALNSLIHNISEALTSQMSNESEPVVANEPVTTIESSPHHNDLNLSFENLPALDTIFNDFQLSSSDNESTNMESVDMDIDEITPINENLTETVERGTSVPFTTPPKEKVDENTDIVTPESLITNDEQVSNAFYEELKSEIIALSQP